MEKTIKRIRHIVIMYLTRRLLKAVTEDQVLEIASKQWLVGTKKLSPGEILDLKQEAKSLRESGLYRLLIAEIRNKATLQRYDQAITADDMIFGKAMLYDFDLIQKFIRKVSQL